MTFNICNLDTIYSGDFSYSVPRPMMEGFLSGVAFDNKVPYTEEEKNQLARDISSLYQEIMGVDPEREGHCVLTAGGPGAGKTRQMRADLQEKGRKYAYIDPDDVCLKKITGFQTDIANDPSPQGRKAAYDKWRPASNAMNHLILAHFIQDRVSFYFGTTATSPAVGKLFDLLKKQDYTTRIIHMTTPDEIRWASIQERDKTFIQTTEEDVRDKGKMFPERLGDYLGHAGKIDFYYRPEVGEGGRLAAEWESGKLMIRDESAYEQVKNRHDALVQASGRADLAWDKQIEKYQTALSNS